MITLNEAATKYNVPLPTLKYACSRGKLAHTFIDKLRYVEPETIEQYLVSYVPKGFPTDGYLLRTAKVCPECGEPKSQGEWALPYREAGRDIVVCKKCYEYLEAIS
jgi:hypothetical protein